MFQQLYSWRFPGNVKFIKDFSQNVPTRSMSERSFQPGVCWRTWPMPQGSPLSGTLLIVTINDIMVYTEKLLYADDLALFYSTSSTVMIKCKLQWAVNNITENVKNDFLFLSSEDNLRSFLSQTSERLESKSEDKRIWDSVPKRSSLSGPPLLQTVNTEIWRSDTLNSILKIWLLDVNHHSVLLDVSPIFTK